MIVDAAAGVVDRRPRRRRAVAEAESRIARARGRRRAPDHRRRARRRHDGPAAREPRLGRRTRPQAVELGAEGVGLFRTEFLFLDAKTAPTVAEQQAQYTALLQAFPGKKVVVRALDAGADKPLAFLNDADEENPALGLRGLRALRATSRSSATSSPRSRRRTRATDADLWVMAPMVADAEETALLHRAGAGARHPHRRRDGRGARRSALLADQILDDRRLRLDRHQRPDPVHARRRPDARHRRGVPGPVAPRRAAARRRGRPGRRRSGQARRHLRRGRGRPAARRRPRRARRDDASR